MEEKKKKILDFIKKERLGIISSINEEEKPESSVIAFAETDNLEIIFGTSCDFRKYENITNNPNVSFVIGWDKITIQYEGVAKEVRGEEFERCKEIQTAKNEASKKYADREDQRYFIIKPKWIRYTNISNEPWEIFEIKF